MIKHLRLWRSDDRGAYELVQFALILPVFIVILYGSFELLKVVSVRHSLDSGVYQAARYLSVYHREYYNENYNRPVQDDQLQAERLVWQSILANPFVTEDALPSIVIRYFNRDGAEITSPVNFPCGQIRQLVNDPNLMFTVRAQATIPWKGTVLGLSLGSIQISSAHSAYVDCGPWYPWPAETPTPVRTPTMPDQP